MTVFRVKEEVKALHFLGDKLTTPSRKRLCNVVKRRRSAKFDSFTLCALTSCVHDFFHLNEIPRAKKITAEFSERTKHPSLRWCNVRHLLADIGLKHGNRSRNSLLTDRDGITDWRNRYLRDVERYRAEGRKIFHLDETPRSRRDTFYRFYGQTPRDFKLSTVYGRRHPEKYIEQVTGEDWRKSIQHVLDVEAKIDLDTSESEHIQPIIMKPGEDDTHESYDDRELSSIEPLDDA
ncbi:hypothetical protein MRX96_034981 [Rhipicephalus microplus]